MPNQILKIDDQFILNRSCVKCMKLKPIEKFKLYRRRHTLRSGETKTYTRHDTTCRSCRWDGVKDRVNQGRRSRLGLIGEANCQAVLTYDWVTFIRSATGRTIPGRVLSQWTGVSESALSRARNDRTWNKRRRL